MASKSKPIVISIDEVRKGIRLPMPKPTWKHKDKRRRSKDVVIRITGDVYEEYDPAISASIRKYQKALDRLAEDGD